MAQESIKQFNESKSPSEISQRITGTAFDEWYREREYRQNIENGKPYFNGSSYVPKPERHSPNALLQCHRKIAYRQENAPEENQDPKGIFWFGTRFEEDIVFPFLRETLTDDHTYIQNSVWVDYTIETDGNEIQIKGSTDPVLVDRDARPLLPTEIKTKGSLEHVDSPNRHHRAQLHAYMQGLSRKNGTDITEGVLVYGSRESMDIQVFHIEFDHDFWKQTVLSWAKDHTQYRLDGQLPPAEPEYDWECSFCSYQNRCGKGDSLQENQEYTGLVLDVEYPREKLVEYLEAHPDAKVPPSVASEIPDLVPKYGVYDWRCSACGEIIPWKESRSDSNGSDRACPECSSRGIFGQLVSPSAEEQRQLIAGQKSDQEESTVNPDA